MAGGKRRYLLSTALIAVLLYMILFPRNLGKELVTIPVWAVSVGNSKISQESGQGRTAYGFRLGDFFGSIRPDGGLIYRDSIDYDVALGDSFFINYSAIPRALVCRDSRGGFLGNVGGNGYPFVRKGRLFVVTVDRYGLSEWSLNGDLLWERRFGTFITAVDASKNSVAVGFLNGNVIVLGEKGKDLFQTSPAGSKYSVILKTGVSDDDRFVGIVSGLEPQKLTIYERAQKNFRAVTILDLKGNQRRAVKGLFVGGGAYFLCEQPGSVEIADPVSRGRAAIPVSGSIVSFGEEPILGLLSVISEKDSAYEGISFLPSGNVILRYKFSKKSSFFFRQTGEFLLFGVDDKLFRVDIKAG